MVVFDSKVNNRDVWIDEIKEYTGLSKGVDVIQLCLSFTLQACRNGDLGMYKWHDGDCL